MMPCVRYLTMNQMKNRHSLSLFANSFFFIFILLELQKKKMFFFLHFLRNLMMMINTVDFTVFFSIYYITVIYGQRICYL